MRDHHAQAAACDHEASDELPGRLIVEADNPSDGCCHIATMASEEEATTVAVKPPVRVLHPAMLDFATEWHHDATASSAEADARLVGPQNRPLHLLNAVFLR